MIMYEKRYRVLDSDEHVLASGMDYEMLLAFILGYKITFCNERLFLIIQEEIIAGEEGGPNVRDDI